MIAAKRITVDFADRGPTPIVYCVQGDSGIRALEFVLLAGGRAVEAPSGVSALIHYARSDGSGGTYDTLPDGTKAWSIDSNVLTVILAGAVCAVNGDVSLSVSLIQGSKQITTFKTLLRVQRDTTGDAGGEGDYVNLAAWLAEHGGGGSGHTHNNKNILDQITEVPPTLYDWAKQPTKPAYTASEVGALPDDTEIPEGLPPVTEADNGKFAGVVNGAWDKVDAPGGSGLDSSEWERVGSFSIDAENPISTVELTTNDKGEAFAYREIAVYMFDVDPKYAYFGLDCYDGEEKFSSNEMRTNRSCAFCFLRGRIFGSHLIIDLKVWESTAYSGASNLPEWGTFHNSKYGNPNAKKIRRIVFNALDSVTEAVIYGLK